MARKGVFEAALEAIDAGRGVALAAVIGAKGSTPRHLGARMAIADDGEQWGTIGGGKIEQLVVAAARDIAAGAPGVIVRQHLIRDLAMCCGGAMAVAITPALASKGVLEQLVYSRQPRILETPLDGGPLRLRGGKTSDPRPARAGARRRAAARARPASTSARSCSASATSRAGSGHCCTISASR